MTQRVKNHLYSTARGWTNGIFTVLSEISVYFHNAAFKGFQPLEHAVYVSTPNVKTKLSQL